MASRPPGCFGALLRPLTGVPRPALADTRALPEPAMHRIDAEDRRTVLAAKGAAEGCMRALPADGRAGSDDVAREVERLVGGVYALAEEIAKARAFLRRHDVSVLARERAELEVHRLGAPPAEQVQIKAAFAALDERGRHAAAVHRELGVMTGRLEASAQILAAFQARIARGVSDAAHPSAGAADLVAEMKEHERATATALRAWAETLREVARLG